MIGILLVEMVLAVLVVVALATQVVVPVLEGTRLFPALRRGRPETVTEEMLRRLNEEGVEQALMDEFTARKAALARHRREAAATTEGEQDGNDQPGV